MVDNFCRRASPTNSREGERRVARQLGLEARCGGEGAHQPSIYRGGAASPCPSSKPWAGGQGREEWGARTLPPSRNSIPSLNDLNPIESDGPYGALCPWPNAARTLPHRPMPPPGRWSHVGPLPEGSRSFRYNTD